MKLVADVNNIKTNAGKLNTEIDNYNSEVKSFESASIDCNISEISEIIESYKSSISNDLSKLSTSSTEYKTLVDECCSEYESNEGNVQTINLDSISEIISNNQDVTIDYQGNAKDKLTGLPSTEIKASSNIEAQKIIDKYSGRNIADLSNDEFLEYIAAAAQIDYETSGILPSVTLAQAICESGWGNSAIGNNLFGIKCGDGWTGKRVNCRTSEQSSGGSYYSINADFRDYDSIVEGVADHSRLLNWDHYAPVKAACDNNDPYEACRQLKACGYATSHSYANTLISIINDNDLTKYDPK